MRTLKRLRIGMSVHFVTQWARKITDVHLNLWEPGKRYV